MRADELLRAIIEYGADESGIEDRFGGNSGLYELCLRDFLNSPNSSALGEAIRRGDYDSAFDAAHALKGLSGNLGLTGYYEAICALTEALRGKPGEKPEAEYARVERELAALRRVCAGEKPAQEEQAAPSGEDRARPDADRPRGSRSKRKRESRAQAWRDRFIRGAAAAILGVFLVAAAAFYYMGHNYREKTKYESGQHLLETGKQISLYLEEQIANDWRIARSIGQGIVSSNYTEGEDSFLRMLREQQEIWGVTDLMLYSENGCCVYSDGEIENVDLASEAAVRARELGGVLSVIDSKLIYTVPIETEQTFRGSRVAALSVVHSMETFLDELDFTSFDNEAWIYLTEDNGIVISMLSTGGAEPTFNVRTIFAGSSMAPLSGSAVSEDPFAAEAPAAFYMSAGGKDRYVVSAPIRTEDGGAVRMRLFYMVPELVVNDTMNDFSRQLTLFGVLVVGLLVGLAALAFLTMYRYRRRQFDAAISAREQMFDLLIQNMRTVFGLFSTERAEPTYISANAREVLGDRYWTIERAGKGYSVRSSSDEDRGLIHQVNELLRQWDGRSGFKSGYLRDDSATPTVWLEMVLYPVGDSGTDFVGIIQDVTSAYEREEVTKGAMEMATRSNEAKTRFLASMSHDIRTPMNAIMNMSSFALESAGEPVKQAEYLTVIHEESKHLLHLINDVLDMSRIESGQTVVASEPFDIKAVLQKQAETMRPLCESKGQLFLVDLNGIRAEAVRGDGLKVAQIIMNLLSNAMKFTPEGGAVRFTAKELPALREEMVSIRFTVEDTGIGISEKNRQHIFEPFARAKDKRVGSIEGTGLGLSICKSYVEAMGGTIACESEEGEGSIFTVELAFRRAAMVRREPTWTEKYGSTPFQGMHCLVAEDVETNRVIARKMLERLGFTAYFAEDGGEAVKMFLSSVPGTYDLVYLDIQMPVLDGYETAVRIRNSQHPQAQTVPILAMSANVFVEDIEKARIAGMDGYVGKPIVSKELIEQTLTAIEIKEGRAR